MKKIRFIAKLCSVFLFMLINYNVTAADEITAIKQGYNDYWSNIKNGRGMCTIEFTLFDPENPEDIKMNNTARVYWVFIGNKIGDCITQPEESDPLKITYDFMYFDGEKVRNRPGENSNNSRDLYSSDITRTNEWDPRLTITMTRRQGTSWEPYPIRGEQNWRILGKEKIGGSECYIVEAIKEMPDKNQTISRRWIDPNRSFCALKGETWLKITPDSVLPEELKWMRTLGDTLINQVDIELQEYADGIWGPAKYTATSYSINREKENFVCQLKRIITYDKQCAYNLDISENDLESEFLAIAANLQEEKENTPIFQDATTCLSNLKQIGLALLLYAQDHNKQFPDDLKEIYPKYIKDPAVFWCPADTDPKPTDITTSEPNALNSCQISYIYYPGHSVGEPDADKIVILEDNSTTHHGGRKNVLFLDGHCALK